MVTKYFNKVEETLSDFDHLVEDYILEKLVYTKEKGMVEGEVFFNNSTQLDFTEVVDTKQKNKQKYSYQYMNEDKEMIFRYDNAEHHREIKTFPHHKHTTNGIVESKEPTLKQVLDEIEQIIVEK